MITLNLKNKSQILLGETLENLKNYLPIEKSIIITDSNINDIYSKSFPKIPKIIIGQGEKIKNLQTIEYVCREMIKLNADRHSFLIGIGGGIVCDLTGFVASIYMRGIDFAFVSSTLLSQTDASVGGKNGVNFDIFKNMLGCFKQPKFVICDINMLDTLPQEEFVNGFAEIIKSAIIKDKDFFAYLEKNYEKALALDKEVLTYIIQKALEIKISVVEKDELENSERKLLNFGHTLAHSIENYYNLSHGKAVAIGIIKATSISLQKNYIKQEDFNSIKKLLKNYNLPVEFSYEQDMVFENLKKDKKRNNTSIDYILLKEIGFAIVENMSFDVLKEYFK